MTASRHCDSQMKEEFGVGWTGNGHLILRIGLGNVFMLLESLSGLRNCKIVRITKGLVTVCAD